MERAALPLTICAVVAAMAAAHCGSDEEPTQIVVRVESTPEECATIQKTIVRVGSFEDYDSPASGEKTGCDPATNRIGTFVLVPKAAHDAEVMLQVIAGVDKNADECRPDNRVDCIFVKRSLRFVPRQTLEVSVLMAGACRGKTCQADETCDPSGQCVPTGGSPGGARDGGPPDNDAGEDYNRCAASNCTNLEGAVCRRDGVCEVNCGREQKCDLVCPSGIACVFNCEKANACASVKCDATNPSCNIKCRTAMACADVMCGSDVCQLSCEARGSEDGRACPKVEITSKNATKLDCRECGCGAVTCNTPECTCAPAGARSCSPATACAGCAINGDSCSD